MADEAAEKDPFAPAGRKGIDRRTFVRRAMGTAAVGALGASGLGLAAPLSTTLGLKIPRFPYLGAKKVDGPAPKGLPLIPVKIINGMVTGVPDRLDWYKYCQHEMAPGLLPTFTDDNKFYYFRSAEAIHGAKEAGLDVWYEDFLGEPLKAEHFDEPGKGAPFRWRSRDQVDNNVITGIAIRVDPATLDPAPEELTEFLDEEILAFCSFCAHFCCVPGFKETAQAVTEGVWDKIFCTCHGSVYDPTQIKQYRFPPNMSF